MLNDIAGMKVLVFGGSSGIGAAAAEAFAAEGADVAIHYARGEERANTVAQKASSHGVKAVTIGADLFEEGAAAAAVKEAAEALGGLDVLINNAGAMVGRARLSDVERKLYDQIMDLNVWAVIEASQAALPYLKASDKASIINLASIAGRNGGGPGAGLYASAKAFVGNYTRNLAKDLAEFGIRANAIAPGFIKTAFHDETPQAVVDSIIASTPLGRAGVAEDCTGSLLFLASPQMSSFITGQTIEINGGALMP
ncbi:3-oxoacyl-[acyl-carrier protein] reductase [Cohaesibacter sp. ES.047]|uniref:SDR family NAD(P)-dependent oxidoreductase n=1 Tax=Cohaesibacter sp. ES.047 TaxID=1798205 RepID=UPI000BB83DC6|nr:SDR family oxidoreductase [Cohaesibacter sp. ES.047]SNY89978.1 3-oxoacyl-[acyl-carrier protein] reductase [Cohaesibacter sp. ES.047]